MPTRPPGADAPRGRLDSRVASYLEAAARSLADGKPEEALGYERLARQRTDKLGSAPSLERGALEQAAGDRASQEGRVEEAFEHYRSALSIHRELGLTSRDTFELTYGTAIAAREAGRTEEAVQLFAGAIELAAKRFGEASLPSVPARVGLAYSLIRLGRLDEAEQALEHALSVCQKHGVNGHRAAALVHEAIAAVRGESGNEEQAAVELTHAADDMEKAEERRSKRERTPEQTRLAEELEVIEGPDDAEDPERVLEDLDSNLIGLTEVKAQFRRLTNLLLVQARRREHGHRVTDRRLHLVMVGPPGTGKTTVASYLGRICRSLGLLDSSDVVVVSRAGLVRGHVGQTALRTNEVVDFALDKVLFVDEAYALAPPGANNDFGPEAIAELMIRMERDADRLVVAVAGYPDEMERFLASNSGFSSRFTDTLTFDHYSAEELEQIFRAFCQVNEYRLSKDAESALRSWCERSVAARDNSFGNGRAMRNLFDDVIGGQADRIVRAAKLEDPEALLWIEAADFPGSLNV
ncbi:MAG TPA: tetratricopeptide repeat protein [Solirubrobacterales bacterium]